MSTLNTLLSAFQTEQLLLLVVNPGRIAALCS